MTIAAIALLTIRHSKTEEDLVRAAVRKLEMSDDPGVRGGNIVAIPKESAPTLLKVLPEVNVPWVFEMVATQLCNWKVKASIPVLVDSLGRDLWVRQYLHHPAEPALLAWGWQAHSFLLDKAASGTYRQRLGCARILAAQCGERPEDERFVRLFVAFSHSSSSEFRRVAVAALSGLTGRIESWMEGVHPGTMDSPKAFEALISLVLDEDREVAREAIKQVHQWLWSHSVGRLESPNVYSTNFFPHPGESATLLELATSKESPYVRASALALLGRPDVVVDALKDRDPFVRRMAVRLLYQNLQGGQLPELKELSVSPDAGIRLAVVDVLSTNHFPGWGDFLRKMKSDPSPVVAAAARRLLSSL